MYRCMGLALALSLALALALALALSVTVPAFRYATKLVSSTYHAHLPPVGRPPGQLLIRPEMVCDICEVTDDVSVSSRSLGTPSCSNTSSAALRFERRRENDCEVESDRASDPAMVTKLPCDSKSETLRSFIEPRVHTPD